MIGSATTAIPVTPEMLTASREVRNAKKSEEDAQANIAEPEAPERAATKPSHPDQAGKLCNVEA